MTKELGLVADVLVQDGQTIRPAAPGPSVQDVLTMKVVCAWCTPQHVIRDGPGPVSHGICEQAKAKLLADDDEGKRL